MSPRSRVALVLGAVVVLVVGLIIASSGGSNDKTSVSKTVTVQDAKAVGGVQSITVKKNGHVDLTVASDTADEIHVHGYNFMKDVKAGGKVHFSFKATIDGKFDIELEAHKQQIASLNVEP